MNPYVPARPFTVYGELVNVIGGPRTCHVLPFDFKDGIQWTVPQDFDQGNFQHEIRNVIAQTRRVPPPPTVQFSAQAEAGGIVPGSWVVVDAGRAAAFATIGTGEDEFHVVDELFQALEHRDFCNPAMVMLQIMVASGSLEAETELASRELVMLELGMEDDGTDIDAESEDTATPRLLALLTPQLQPHLRSRVLEATTPCRPPARSASVWVRAQMEAASIGAAWAFENLGAYYANPARADSNGNLARSRVMFLEAARRGSFSSLISLGEVLAREKHKVLAEMCTSASKEMMKGVV